MTKLENKMIVILLIAAIFFLPACSKKDSQAKKPQSSSTQKTKAPKDLKNINTELEKILAALEQKVKIKSQSVLVEESQNAQKTGQNQGQSQQSQQNQQGQDQQSQSNQSQQGQQSQQNQSKSSTDQGKTSWQKEVGSIKKIHQSWNQLEPEAVKAGLENADRDGFEQAMEKLTLQIGKQKTEESLMAAIALYGQFASLVKIFETTVPPEFYQVKYEIMSAIAEAGKSKWEDAQKRIPVINDYWNHLKVKAKVKDEKILTQTEFAIEDMALALESKEADLLLVKAEIVIKNLQSLEKKLSSQQSGQTS